MKKLIHYYYLIRLTIIEFRVRKLEDKKYHIVEKLVKKGLPGVRKRKDD